MDRERWHRVDELFHRALATDPGERDAWLEATTTDPELRSQVEALLRAHAADVPMLDRGPEALVSVLRDGDFEPAIGTRIGHYLVTRELGRGGMGVVYLAERDDADFRQQVALKCLRPGVVTADLVGRFRRERRILASLVHPNIAQLYDGGYTDSGEPYIVMEYVEGEPIDRYCERRRLSVRQRMALFATVCDAVESAHRHLVVHRDLKPGNVLVSDDGHVKLLDFGIAKLTGDVEDDEAATRFGARPLTPDYASPEQIRGEPATTASDVYGLGIMLHELLTGRKPAWQPRLVASGGAIDVEVARETPSRRVRLDTDAGAIAAARGTSPDQLSRQLRGDLDTIVLTALHPDPRHRYGSVRALLDDVTHWRAGRPITARAPTAAYRLAKFVRRNRALSAAAVLAAMLAVGYVMTVVAQSRRIAAERDRAEYERATAVQVADVLAGLFDAADPLARERADTLRVADMLDRASQQVREQLAGQPQVLAEVLTVLSRVQYNLSRYDDALALAEEAVAIRRTESGTGGLQLAESLNRLGLSQQRAGRAADAEATYREVSAIRDSLDAPARLRVESLINIAGSLQDQMQFDSAATLYDRALDLIRAQPAIDTAQYANLLNQRARLAMVVGDDANATEITGQIVEIQRAALGPDHPRLALDLANYGAMLARTGQDSAAESVLREAIDIAERTVGPRNQTAAESKQVLGGVLARRGNPEAGERLLADAVQLKIDLLGRANPQLAPALSTHADVLARLGRNDEALESYREAFQIARDAGDLRGAGINQSRLARIRCEMGDTRQALMDFAESVATLESVFSNGGPFVIAAQRDLGRCHARMQDWPAAETELISAYELASQQLGVAHPETMRCAQALVQLYEAMGEPDKAEPYRTDGDQGTSDK